MIGFNHLGQLGRLGNQMFQYAALKGIARKNKYEYCIPPSNESNEWTDHQLLIPFKLSNTTRLNIQFIDEKRPLISEKTFAFDSELFNNCPDWVSLHGYFQSEKYFKHIEEEIKEDFKFKDEIYNSCKDMIAEVKSPISLHIRRTDYITNSNHTCLNLSYYKKALNEFEKSCSVLVFSDDPKWCSEQELFSDDRFLISEFNSNYIDLCLMTLCKGHIIANSSFSWWGAWLSNSEKIIAPDGWFKGSDNANLDTTDLIPDHWIIIGE